MRVLVITAFKLIAFSALVVAEEIDVPHWKASSTIEGARFKAGQESIVVTFERADFDRKNHKTRKPGWGWDTRIELDSDRGENQYLVTLTILVDGTPFVVPRDHLIDLFNPSSDLLSVTRNAKTNSLQVTITGGHTPDIYEVTFCFKHGKYVRREFAYVEADPNIGKRDAGKVEIYKGEQGGTGQPATDPELKPEGNDKPKPESEGRSQ